MGTLVQLARGSRFARLHAEHAAFLARRIHSLQPWIPPSLHADVLQEVWEVVHRRIDDVPHDELERPWLVKVLRFKLLHHARSHARARRKEDALTPVTPTQADDGAQFESREMISQILDALPEEQREVIVRIELFGESANEVAEQAKVPANTVYGRLRLARARISRMGLTLGLWLAWLRASARDFIAAPTLQALVGTFVFGVIASSSLPPSGSDPGTTRAEQSVVDLVERSGGVLDAAPDQLTPEPPEPPAPAEPAAPETQLGTRPDEGLPVAGEPSTAAPDAPSVRAPRPQNKAPKRPKFTGSQRYIQKAENALRRGNGTAALRHIKKHRRKFPAHEQTHIIEAFEIEALCQLGRNEEAKVAFTAASAKYTPLPIQLRERRNKRCW